MLSRRLPASGRGEGWECIFGKGVYLTLWFWRSKNSRKVLNQVENKATANALWVCKYPCACLSMYPMYGERQRRYMIYIGVGLQRCSFRLDGQCEKPLERGTSNSTESPRLFCICTVQRVVTEKEQRPHLGETEKHKRKENDGMNIIGNNIYVSHHFHWCGLFSVAFFHALTTPFSVFSEKHK